jgi:hypothetical protein
VDGDADEHVLGSRLRVLDEHVEVPVLVEGARIEQLVLEILARAPSIALDQVSVRVFALRDTCRGTSCTSASACCRRRSSTP